MSDMHSDNASFPPLAPEARSHSSIETSPHTETRNLREVVRPKNARPGHSKPPAPARISPASAREAPSAAVYGAMVRDLKARYKISIRKWRTHMSGVAYELTYADGRIKRLISAPRPRSPVSAAIFLHEVGHHAIGFRRYSPRCLEEFYVWQWTFREMHARGIPANDRVMRHYRRSMYHYIKTARRQGQHVPQELAALGHWPG